VGWAGQTWLELIQEGTGGTNYGTFNAAPSGGQVIYPTLAGPNSFTPRTTPARNVIRTADAGNRRRQVVAAFSSIEGTLNTILYPTEAAYWITAATALTNDAGGHPCLPSYSALYWDSTQAWKLLGGRIRSLTITASAQQDYVTLSVNWIFQRRDATFTTFAQPAESNYPTIVPYQYVETAGNVTVGGAAITKYRTLNLTFNNVLAPTRDENAYISDAVYCGRDLDFTFGPQYVTTSYRGAFEAQTPLTWIISWVRASPAHSLIINAKTNTYYSNVDDDLPLDGPAYQTVTGQVFFDPANSVDFSTVVT
jgi:hypothetical protein